MRKATGGCTLPCASPVRGGCFILVAQGQGVGCVCLGVCVLPGLLRPFSSAGCPASCPPLPGPAGREGLSAAAAAAALVRGDWSAGRGLCVARLASSGTSAERGCGPGGSAGPGWATAAAAASADPALGPGASQEKTKERGRRSAVGQEMQPAQSLEGNRLQTRVGTQGGGARRPRTRKAAGSKRDGQSRATLSPALPSPLQAGGREWREGGG